jgi:hypothetical protein
VAALADDLAKPPGLRRWIVDLVSPGLSRMMTKQFGKMLAEGNAPFKFSPGEGPEFFTPHGWSPKIVRSMLKTAAAKKRVNFFMRLMARLPEPKGPLGGRIWGGVCLLERPDLARSR